jgi:hypothetical protein
VLLAEAEAAGVSDSAEASLFHILHGDLSLLGPAPDVAVATASFDRAFVMAERYNAPMPQLRAAARLSRVADESDRGERLEKLRSVYATFTEGFATPDLIEAAELLA